MTRAILVSIAAVFVLCATFTSANANEPKDDATAQRDHWQKTLAQAEAGLTEATQRVDRAQLAYKNMRHRNRLRGEKKRLIIEEVAAAKAALELARTEFEATKIASQRAGFPPVWIGGSDKGALPASGVHR